MLQDEPTPVPPCPDMNGDLFLLKEMLSTLVKAVIIEVSISRNGYIRGAGIENTVIKERLELSPI